MAITTRDSLIAAVAAGQEIDYVKGSLTIASGRYASLFRTIGRPGPAAAPATVAGNTCTSATVGALPFTNPSGTNLSYLAQLGVSGTAVGSLILYDRLVETALLNGTVTTAQTVGTVALPARGGTGAGVAMWLEVYSALGGTASGATVSYTNSVGVAGRTGTVIGGIPATAVQGTMLPIALQSGDWGVRSVETVTLAVTTGTAGSFGITLLQRVAEIPTGANTSTVFSWADLGLPQIKNDACLAFMFIVSGSATPVVVGSALIAQG